MHKFFFCIGEASVVAVLLVGCEVPTKVTGGGRIDSVHPYPGEVAAFGFNATTCDGMLRGQVTLVDHEYPPFSVQLRADVTHAAQCELLGCGECYEGELVVDASYTSTNQERPGSGILSVCLRDGGEGQDAEDNAFIRIHDGPLMGYMIEGPVSGNVQEHGCE